MQGLWHPTCTLVGTSLSLFSSAEVFRASTLYVARLASIVRSAHSRVVVSVAELTASSETHPQRERT